MLKLRIKLNKYPLHNVLFRSMGTKFLLKKDINNKKCYELYQIIDDNNNKFINNNILQKRIKELFKSGDWIKIGYYAEDKNKKE